MDETRQEILKDLEFPLGTIQILRKHWTGWVGSKNYHFCLLSVHRGPVGGSEKVQESEICMVPYSDKE